jgi:saccharopine dehydrogenase-like NADP-dependent oxidoreductase
MANITVLGTGLVGKAIVLDLARQHDVVAVDNNSQALKELASRDKTINLVQADLSVASNVITNVGSADLVVSAVPGFMGYQTLKTIISCNKNVVDIAFFPENALQLDELAKQHNVTAVVDMGVAPGLSNLILGYHSNDMVVDHFKCMVGGLPKHPRPPFNYKAPFSPVDVIEEYTRPARLVRNGKVITMPALSEIELVKFENAGTLEAFNTDGLRTLIESFPDIPNMVEKTLRYPGHASLIQTLKDIGYLDSDVIQTSETPYNPLQLSTALFKKHWQLAPKEPEFTIMRINLSGRRKSDNTVAHYQYDLYDEYHEKTDIGSMARTTGYTCTAAVNLLLENMFIEAGIIPPELIGRNKPCYKNVLSHYEQKDIRLEQTIA